MHTANRGLLRLTQIPAIRPYLLAVMLGVGLILVYGLTQVIILSSALNDNWRLGEGSSKVIQALDIRTESARFKASSTLGQLISDAESGPPWESSQTGVSALKRAKSLLDSPAKGTEAAAGLEHALATAKTSFSSESQRKLNSLIAVIYVGTTALVVFVFLSYVLIVNPQIRKLRLLGSRLTSQNDALRDQSEIVQMQNEEIEQMANFLEKNFNIYADAARSLDQLFRGLPLPTLTFDRFYNIVQWNQGCSAIFGVPEYEAAGKNIRDVIRVSEDQETSFENLLDSPLKFEERTTIEWQFHNFEGAPMWFEAISFPIIGPNGNAIYGAIVMNDITSRKEYEALVGESVRRLNDYSVELELQKSELMIANDRLEKLTTSDGLTGLLNHRAFQGELANRFDGMQTGKGKSLGLLILDVDHFKKFNDTYGHQEGDIVLQAVAKVLQEECPSGCTACRYGGEEFVIVMPELSVNDLKKFAEHFRRCIEGSCPNGHTVTASFGLALYNPDLYGPPELIAQADKALYHSKRSGRNRVTFANDLWNDEQAA